MKHRVEVDFDEFGWAALRDEAARQGVSVDELLRHAAMYYLADADSPRMSHKVVTDLPLLPDAQVGR